MRPFPRSTAPAALFGAALAAAALGAGAQSGGIVKTEFNRVTVQPGPAPDLAVFATGECLGKIEPCG